MNLDETLDLLSRDPEAPVDLAELCLLLARDEYPDLDVEAYLGEIAGMAHEAGKYMRGNLEARVHGLCRYLFHEMGFRGNKAKYYDPLNSYLNQVLDRRTGIPITLSAVAMAVGTRAGLKVVGVGLPGHFVARAIDDGGAILFDPFHGGRVLTIEDCQNLVQQVTGMSFEVTRAHLEPVCLQPMVQRMLANLKTIYLGEKDIGRALHVIERMRQLDPDNPGLLRDLGVALIQGAKPGQAIGPLGDYLKATPDAPDGEAIRQLIERAQSEIAKWN